MTYEQAKEILQEERDYAQLLSYVNKALDMAKDALEKQIPKEPKNYLVNMHTQDYLCPLCRIRIISKISGEFIAGKKDKYCSNCGQKIDWSDVK